MFAVMVAGRLPQVDFQTVDSNKYLITIPDADSINFLVVFMTGSVAFPPGEIGLFLLFSLILPFFFYSLQFDTILVPLYLILLPSSN